MKAGATEHVWIFVLLPDPLDKRTDDCERGRHTPRSFVLTGAEVQALGETVVEQYRRRYQEKHGEPSRDQGEWANIQLATILPHEAAWDKYLGP